MKILYSGFFLFIIFACIIDQNNEINDDKEMNPKTEFISSETNSMNQFELFRKELK